MKAAILLVTPHTTEGTSYVGYYIGVIIAVMILGYLVFTLIKPEKF